MMAVGHIASISGSARMAAQQQRQSAAIAAQDESKENKGQSNKQLEQNSDQVSTQLAVMSISDVDDEPACKMSDGQASSSNIHLNQASKMTAAPPPPLEILNSVADIESHYDSGSHQMITLNKLEQKWIEITKNFNEVIGHLSSSSAEVTKASEDCLQSLKENVEKTCDKVDLELKAQYQLMTKCDELTTKLSTASSFRNEVKTLRKSVETLEQLYKTRSQSRVQPRATLLGSTSNDS